MSRLIIRLKVIEYKKDFFCYLSFYLDLDFWSVYLKILFFRPHIFKFLFFKPHAFRIFNETYLPKFQILDPFQQS